MLTNRPEKGKNIQIAIVIVSKISPLQEKFLNPDFFAASTENIQFRGPWFYYSKYKANLEAFCWNLSLRTSYF